MELSKLYESDFAAWAADQARALRLAEKTHSHLPLDWENLASELEGTGHALRTDLRRHIAVLIEHLLRLELSAHRREHREAWEDTVQRTRIEAARILEASPSLRPLVPVLIDTELRRTARLVAMQWQRGGEMTPTIADRLRTAAFPEAKLLGDWLP